MKVIGYQDASGDAVTEADAVAQGAPAIGTEFKLRDKAIFWLGQRRGNENATFLRELYAKERDAKLKDKIIFALSQQRGNDTWLMEIATNENETIEMRKKAQEGALLGRTKQVHVGRAAQRAV